MLPQLPKLIATILIAGTMPLAGCSSLESMRSPEFVTASAQNPVVEVMCLWKPGQGIDQNGVPTRGFAGQVMFFTRDAAAAATVNGKVRIYVFDDVGSIDEQAQPIDEFELTSEQWNANLYESNLGAKYQIFVPYTRKGGNYAKCALRVQYIPADGGPPAFSRMAAVELPGRRRPRSSEQAQRPQLPEEDMPKPTGVFEVKQRTMPDLGLEGRLTPPRDYGSELSRLNAAALDALSESTEPQGF